ncbi:ATP synthase subunit s, mitochondrial [Xylocopa sonorina]|uniref:ATP synthase subunit s, mitochondrial n=1 Tax=Xylocopa sonorina TaxID=1818115 RepID=UPI00403ABDC0
MAIHTLSRSINSAVFQNIKSQNRPLFYWLTVVFNRVDEDRLKEIGPDRACAEWLLRNGASVRWKGFSEQLTDYNAIPGGGNYLIEAVEANNAGICDVGFRHFEGCKYIKKVKLENCKYIDNNALRYLSLLQDSLTNLEIINCKSVDDDGLFKLKVLKNLETLKIKGLPAVDNNIVQKELTEALPSCKIDIE